MTLFDAVIFDKDGCLFDFQATWGVWAGRVLSELADGDDAVLRRMADAIDYDLDHQVIRPQSIVVAGTPLEICQTIAPILNRPAVELLGVLNDQAAQAPQVIVEGLIPTLKSLRATGIKLAVMTNDSERPARAHLQAAGIEGLFDVIVGSDSGFGAKPDPDPLLAILGQLSVAPDRAIMIGDSLHDLDAGQAAGMTCVGVLTGLANQATLSVRAQAVLPSAASLQDWIMDQPDPTQ